MKCYKSTVWLFLLAGLFNYLPGKLFAYPAPADGSSCQLELTGSHHHLYCLDEVSMEALPAPTVRSYCNAEATLSYRERYDDLGCGASGFTGYFEPSRWMVSKIYGDDGVDVTGAPNALLVEGADNTLVSATPGGVTRIHILIPADGIVAFDWRSIGGSNLFSNSLQVSINEQVFSLTQADTREGRFRRPVRTGDELSFRLSAPEPLSFELENFRLLTNAIGAYQRVWTATDSRGQQSTFTQFITIEQPSIVEVRFPDDRQNVSPTREATAPAATGYPYFDRDGDPATTGDRYQLKGKSCAYQVEHIDELQRLGEECVLIRRWIISDACGSNTMQETQIIKLRQTPATDNCPEELLLPPPAAPQTDPQPPAEEVMSAQPFTAEQHDNDNSMTL